MEELTIDFVAPKTLMKYMLFGIGASALYWLLTARTPILAAATIFLLMIW